MYYSPHGRLALVLRQGVIFGSSVFSTLPVRWVLGRTQHDDVVFHGTQQLYG